MEEVWFNICGCVLTASLAVTFASLAAPGVTAYIYYRAGHVTCPHIKRHIVPEIIGIDHVVIL